MSMFGLSPDSAIGILMFSHRHSWDGTICRDAARWSCGTTDEFRSENCAKGRDRCHVIHAFNRIGPRVRLNFDVLNWALAEDPACLNGRLMLLWSKATSGDFGITPGMPSFRVAGAYRVQRVEKSGIGVKFSWEVFPYPDQWCRFPELKFSPPAFTETSSNLCKIIAGHSAETFLQRVRRSLGENGDVISQDADRTRIEGFVSTVETWQNDLRHSAKAHQAHHGLRSTPFAALDRVGLKSLPTAPKSPPVSVNPIVIPEVESGRARGEAAVAAANPAPQEAIVPAPATHNAQSTVTADPGFLEANTLLQDIEKRYGATVVKALLSAAASRKIILFRGLPGAGKSHLARQLLFDPAMQRTFIQPVAATWRGAEDLLGYVNPIDRKFQPTAFTRFLLDAERAWDAEDRRHRVVIFEEFNLSQPEYWLTDLLVRLEYPAEDRKARTIVLSSSEAGSGQASVYLTPALRFVATLNSDHTTRPLSPRVLDRSAVIELRSSPDQALEAQQVTLAPAELQAIRDLDFALRAKGVSFSHRTARSLRSTLDAAGTEEPRGTYIDVVLSMELMSKVRLHTSNPSDTVILANLEKWADEYAKELPECVRMIRAWRELLEAGQDVVQT